MPSGVAYTVWLNAFYVEHARDDIAFIKTAYNIFKYLNGQDAGDWNCVMPVKPFDDLLIKLNDDQRRNFLKKVDQLIEKSAGILGKENQADARKEWKKIFGKWFPENLKENQI